MPLLERLNFEHEFSWLDLEGLSALQRKLLIDLIRRGHPQLWSRFKSHAYSWNTTKEHLNQFINLHPSEFFEELKKAGFNHDDHSKTAKRRGGAYV